MRKLEENFTYKGVTFKIIKRGQKAIMLDAKADFYNSNSVEVWQLRYSKDRMIKGNLIKASEKKPSNEDYPYVAHQFMGSHFENDFLMLEKALERFNEYENGIRPKSIKL